MQLVCAACGKEICLEFPIEIGQNVRCPYCSQKFTYDKGCELLTEVSESNIRKAVAECLKDEKTLGIWHKATPGARRFLELVYYGRIFGRRTNQVVFLSQFDIVIPTLVGEDVRFLLAHETDPQLSVYLSKLSDAVDAVAGKRTVEIAKPVLRPIVRERTVEVDRSIRPMRVDDFKVRSDIEERSKRNDWIRNLVSRCLVVVCCALFALGLLYVLKIGSWGDDRDDAVRTENLALKSEITRMQSEVAARKRDLEAKVRYIAEREAELKRARADSLANDRQAQKEKDDLVRDLRTKDMEISKLRAQVASQSRESPVESPPSGVGARRKVTPSNHTEVETAEPVATNNDIKSVRDKIKEIEAKLRDLRMKNPACILNEDPRDIKNTIKKLPKRADKKYYLCSNITVVRPRFYCTRCKTETEDYHQCRASQVSFPLWRAARDKVQETIDMNSQIDVLCQELESLEEKRR